jgi:hypothetical protein
LVITIAIQGGIIKELNKFHAKITVFIDNDAVVRNSAAAVVVVAAVEFGCLTH